MSTDLRADIKASRLRVPRSRGALSGVLLLVLGLWAAIVPFIGPYFNFAFTPAPNTSWKWTAARLYLEVLPGAAAFLGGILLLASASRLTTIFGAWLGVAGGAWLVVGPVLADPIGINIGQPDPSSGKTVQALEQLFFFFAIGAAILFVAATALGRLSVHSIRDVRAARRRTEAEEAAAAEAERREMERREAERRDVERRDVDRGDLDRRDVDSGDMGRRDAEGRDVGDAGSTTWSPAANEAGPHAPQHSAPPPSAAGNPPPPGYTP